MKEFNREIAESMFTIAHFRGCEGYRWIPSAKRFSTPLVCQMKANQTQDNMLPAIKIFMKKKEKNEKERLAKENKEKKKKKSL